MSKALRSMLLLVMFAALALVAVGCGKSTDASLQSLAVYGDTLTPAFTPTTFNYTIDMDTFTSSYLTHVTATPTNSEATMQLQVGTGSWVDLPSGVASGDITLSTGDTDISVKVTAGDGTTFRVYKVTATVSHVELPHF